MRVSVAVLGAIALAAAGCGPGPAQAPPGATRQEEAAPQPAAEPRRWGFAADDLARVEALSGGGTVRLPVPQRLWGELVAALDSAERGDEPGPWGPRSPVLRFALLNGRELRLDLIGREHWRLVRRDGETLLAPCPALKRAARLALRLACASAAAHIAVAKVVPDATEGRPTLEVLRTLKGSATAGARLIVEGSPLPSPGGPEALCLAFLRVEADGLGVPRFHRLLPVGTLWGHTDELEAKVRESIPLPEAWGDAAGGLRLGLRARESGIVQGGELPIEVCIQNVGKRPIALLQHRLNIYDYYPHTRFTVTAPDGSQRELAKPLGAIEEADAPLGRTLRPGEAYIHTVRLSQWPAAEGSGPAGDAFARPGRYAIRCTYSVAASGGGGAHWAGTLTAPPITIRVWPKRPERRDPGGLI